MAKGTRKTAKYGPAERAVKQAFYIKPGAEAAERWQEFAESVGFGDKSGELFVLVARGWINALKSLI